MAGVFEEVRGDAGYVVVYLDLVLVCMFLGLGWSCVCFGIASGWLGIV